MQNDVNLSTKDDELEIKYGPYNSSHSDDERVLAFSALKYILSDMNVIRERYISLGFHLSEFRRCGYYFTFGYARMEDFCAANLGLDKSAVSRCISVWENFAFVDDSHSRKMWIDDKYKEYSYSQLCEMVSMNDEKRRQVTPDMTIKQIREVKKGNVSQVAMSQPEKEKYSVSKFCDLKGIVRQNYIKELDGERFTLEIFDCNGKHVFHAPCFLFNKDANFIHIRLADSVDTSFFPD